MTIWWIFLFSEFIMSPKWVIHNRIREVWMPPSTILSLLLKNCETSKKTKKYLLNPVSFVIALLNLMKLLLFELFLLQHWLFSLPITKVFSKAYQCISTALVALSLIKLTRPSPLRVEFFVYHIIIVNNICL